jgi:hypothetical protein
MPRAELMRHAHFASGSKQKLRDICPEVWIVATVRSIDEATCSMRDAPSTMIL